MGFGLIWALQDWSLLIARIIVGSIFIYYGWPKIKDLKSNAKDFEKMGFKPGMLFGTGIALLEFFGGIAVLLGIWVESFSLLLGLHMLTGSVWKITSTDKKFTDWSYDLLLLALALLFIMFGAGKYALI